jgi:hypothetical protein
LVDLRKTLLVKLLPRIKRTKQDFLEPMLRVADLCVFKTGLNAEQQKEDQEKMGKNGKLNRI